MSRILLLEDDAVLSQTMKAVLQEEGFDVVPVKDGNTALDRTFNEHFDLYLLDVNVPYLNGFDFLQQMRDSGDRTPAFFVTALRDLGSLSKGFDTGADDYIKKPFDMDELLVRIKSTIRKQYDFLEYGNIKYDPLNKRALVNNKEIPLTYVERYIFDLLIRNLEQNVSKEQFFEVMERPSEMALRVHINKLKHKLGIGIKNARGIGYRLEKP
ncbi:MAG: response regulator transcription factor [Epsilonproteobacteria bacterium]|nr:response regulator transcription factor [Campylobacterota bacterium]